MKVTNYKDFQLFKYTDEGMNHLFSNGDILIKENEVGVVIQEYGNEEFRTDMWGNSHPSECRLATIDEVKKFRQDLLKHINYEKDKI